MISIYGDEQRKRFVPFSYLNHSVIESKCLYQVYYISARFILLYLFVELCWIIVLCINFTFCLFTVKGRGGGGGGEKLEAVKKFQDWQELLFWRGLYQSGLQVFISHRAHFILYATRPNDSGLFYIFIKNQLISLKHQNNSLDGLMNNCYIKGTTKLKTKLIFVFATKIDENTTNIQNCCFSQQIYTLSHQTKYLYIEN